MIGRQPDGTGNNELVEASPNDHLWGMGVSMFDPTIMSRQTMWGKTLQGQSLMKERKYIRVVSAGYTTQ